MPHGRTPRTLVALLAAALLTSCSSASLSPKEAFDEAVKASGSTQVGAVRIEPDAVTAYVPKGDTLEYWSSIKGEVRGGGSADRQPNGAVEATAFPWQQLVDGGKDVTCENNDLGMQGAITHTGSLIATYNCGEQYQGVKKVAIDGKVMPDLTSMTEPDDLKIVLEEMATVVGPKALRMMFTARPIPGSELGIDIVGAPVKTSTVDACSITYLRTLSIGDKASGIHNWGCSESETGEPFDIADVDPAELSAAIKAAQKAAGVSITKDVASLESSGGQLFVRVAGSSVGLGG